MSDMRYQPSSDENSLKKSVQKIVRLILKTPDIHEVHKKRFVDRCLWQFTIAEGKNKYDLRYVSEAALPLLKANNRSNNLRHDHVLRREVMVQNITEHPSRARAILNRAVGCVVTKDEHQRLGEIPKSIDGWQRYKKARVSVIDRTTGKRASLRKLCSEC